MFTPNFILLELQVDEAVFVNGELQLVVDIRPAKGLGIYEYKVTNYDCWFPGFYLDKATSRMKRQSAKGFRKYFYNLLCKKD